MQHQSRHSHHKTLFPSKEKYCVLCTWQCCFFLLSLLHHPHKHTHTHLHILNLFGYITRMSGQSFQYRKTNNDEVVDVGEWLVGSFVRSSVKNMKKSKIVSHSNKFKIHTCRVTTNNTQTSGFLFFCQTSMKLLSLLPVPNIFFFFFWSLANTPSGCVNLYVIEFLSKQKTPKIIQCVLGNICAQLISVSCFWQKAPWWDVDQIRHKMGKWRRTKKKG